MNHNVPWFYWSRDKIVKKKENKKNRLQVLWWSLRALLLKPLWRLMHVFRDYSCSWMLTEVGNWLKQMGKKSLLWKDLCHFFIYTDIFSEFSDSKIIIIVVKQDAVLRCCVNHCAGRCEIKWGQSEAEALCCHLLKDECHKQFRSTSVNSLHSLKLSVQLLFALRGMIQKYYEIHKLVCLPRLSMI